MKLVDVHCHINHELFKGKISEVIERSQKAGVKAIIVNGVNLSTNKEVLELANKHSLLKPALGLYPLDAVGLAHEAGLKREEKTNADEVISFIKKSKDKIIAIGEVGLDYKFGFEKKEEQKQVFQKIIELSKKINKPLIVHSRNAESDVLDMLEKNNAKKIVLHCFSARKQIVKHAAELGFSLSIPAVVKKLKHFEMVIEEVPLEQLLTETDAPWLSPYIGKINEPAFVVESINKISLLKKIDPEEAANQVFLNYQRMFE
ncbi:TatD family hydrolase [Candidatus Woesearchaeota archaeon]|nr:TatD family hydrolase [Candidatus Woesearchaeota archaeon]